jgi:hypothetical protein
LLRHLKGLTVAVALLLAACATATTPREAPVLMHPTLPLNLGQTICSFNNQPVVLMDSAVLVAPEIEIIMVHEQTHARRMQAHKGGCHAFALRYRTDSVFRVQEEMAAYCAEGQFALTRNRSAESAWGRIQFIMRERYGVRLTDAQNCLR